MQPFFIQRLARPCDQRLHLARRVEGGRRFEDDANLLPIRIERHDIVGNSLVGAAMALILVAMA